MSTFNDIKWHLHVLKYLKECTVDLYDSLAILESLFTLTESPKYLMELTVFTTHRIANYKIIITYLIIQSWTMILHVLRSWRKLAIRFIPITIFYHNGHLFSLPGLSVWNFIVKHTTDPFLNQRNFQWWIFFNQPYENNYNKN